MIVGHILHLNIFELDWLQSLVDILCLFIAHSIDIFMWEIVGCHYTILLIIFEMSLTLLFLNMTKNGRKWINKIFIYCVCVCFCSTFLKWGGVKWGRAKYLIKGESWWVMFFKYVFQTIFYVNFDCSFVISKRERLFALKWQKVFSNKFVTNPFEKPNSKLTLKLGKTKSSKNQ